MIETERIILRSFVDSDYKDLFEYLNKPTVHCFYDMKVESLDDAKKEAISRSQKEDYFAIVLKSENKVIGEVFSEGEPTNFFTNVIDTYSPCYMLNPNYQKNGYMEEALVAYLYYLFDIKNARRVYAYTEDYNLSSQKLLRKLFFREEGLFKEFVSFVNDEQNNPIYENTYQFALLKKEWEEHIFHIKYKEYDFKLIKKDESAWYDYDNNVIYDKDAYFVINADREVYANIYINGKEIEGYIVDSNDEIIPDNFGIDEKEYSFRINENPGHYL